MTILNLQSSFAQVPAVSPQTVGIAPLSYETPELAGLRRDVQQMIHGINHHPLEMDERCRRIQVYIVRFTETCTLPYEGYAELKRVANIIKATSNLTGEHEAVTDFVQRLTGPVAACDLVGRLLIDELPVWTTNFPNCFEVESAPQPQPRHAPVDFQSNQSVSV